MKVVARDPDTLSQPAPARLVTVMGFRTLLLAAVRRHTRRRRFTPRRCLLPISAANWLSREPARTLRSQVRGFRPCPTAAAAHLGSGATPNVFAWPSTATSERRKRRCRPWAAAQLVLRPWLPPSSPPGRVPGVPGFGSCGPCQPFTRSVSRRAGDPCRASFPCQHPGSVTNRLSSSCVPPTKATHAWRARVAFHRTGPVRARLGLRLDRCFPAATSAPALPPGPGFRHAFTPGAPSARPAPLSGFRQCSEATCRLSTSAAECSPSTPASSPTPAGHHGFWPPCRRATPSLSSRRRPSCLRPGVSRALARPTPHHGDRSPRWIYPNLIDSSTCCRAFVPARAWKTA